MNELTSARTDTPLQNNGFPAEMWGELTNYTPWIFSVL